MPAAASNTHIICQVAELNFAFTTFNCRLALASLHSLLRYRQRIYIKFFLRMRT